jgi:omega-6 fatty acid desaturase (delta-12 desaturase)
MPHYTNATWNFARGATATIDRDLGFIDTHLFHDIIGTHVCHHLVSTIPFYHAGEASIAIRKVMGKHYAADTKTPFWTAFWRNQRTCKFVEETEGCEGQGVYMFRNLYNKKGETQPKKLVDVSTKTEGKMEVKGEMKSISAMQTAMSSGRNLDARRRLSQSAKVNLPIMTEG